MVASSKSNSELHPKAWKYFTKNARYDGTIYFIKDPSCTALLEADDPKTLFNKFIKKWYTPTINNDNELAVVNYIANNL